MTPDPRFFTRCSRSEAGAQYHHGEYWRFWDDRSLSLLISEWVELQNRQGDWDELEREKNSFESQAATLEEEAINLNSQIEDLELQLEAAQARIAELEGNIIDT